MNKSLWLRVILALPFLALSACGGGGGGSGGNNTAPVANFAYSCVDLVCTFTSTSSDPDVGDSIANYKWTFGDSSAAATVFNPDHTFAAAGTYPVTLLVGDRFGKEGSVVRQVNVTAPPTPAGPNANFTFSCLSLDCKFTDTTTFDPGSVFQSRVWDFGDSVTLAATNPADHRYAVTTLTSFPVKLTVTDAAGKVSTSTQTVPVSPPATSLGCVGGGCVLTLTQAASVTATIVSRSCVAQGNQVRFTSPITQLVFANGCYDTPINVPVPIGGGQVFAAGTTLEVAVSSGVVGTAGLVYPPSIRVSGDFTAGWTLSFDDGKGGAGEPDFNDLIILIKATP